MLLVSFFVISKLDSLRLEQTCREDLKAGVFGNFYSLRGYARSRLTAVAPYPYFFHGISPCVCTKGWHRSVPTGRFKWGFGILVARRSPSEEKCLACVQLSLSSSNGIIVESSFLTSKFGGSSFHASAKWPLERPLALVNNFLFFLFKFVFLEFFFIPFCACQFFF